MQAQLSPLVVQVVIGVNHDTTEKYCCRLATAAGNALGEARHIPRQELHHHAKRLRFFSTDFSANTDLRRSYAHVMRTAELQRLQLCKRYRPVSEVERCFSVDIAT